MPVFTSHRAVPLSPAARRTRWGVGLVFFVNGAAFASWVSRIPALRAGLHLSDGTLGSVLFAMSAGVLLSFPLAGKGAQLLGVRRIALLAGLLLLLMLPVPFLVDIVPSLVLVMLELGVASGAMQVAMNVLAVEAQARLERPVIASLHGLWSAGGLVGAGLGSLAARAGLAPALHLGLVSAALAVALAAAALLLARGRLPCPPLALPVAAPVAPTARRRFGFDRRLAGLGLICFCAFLTEGALADWSAVYLREKAHASESIAALGYAVFAGAMTIMRLFGEGWLQRLGNVRLLRAFNALGAAALALALALARVDVTLLACVLLGLGLATVVPATFAAAARPAGLAQAQAAQAVQAAQAARAIALMSACGYSGLLVGPPLIGWLAQASDLSWALGLLVALVAAVAALVRLLGVAAPATLAEAAEPARRGAMA